MNQLRDQGLDRLKSLEISKGQSDFIVMHYLIGALKHAIGRYGKGDVLDIGCGNKPYQVLFQDNIGKYLGCDVVQSSLNAVDIICNASQIPLKDHSFDTILCTQVLEHVSDPEEVTGEAFRLLRSSGIFIISVPFSWELHEEPYDFFRYTKYGIRALLEKKGFEVCSIQANGGKWAAILQLTINMVYSSFIGKKGVLNRLVKFVFIHLGFTRLLNSIAIWMDDKWFDELLTLNYVIVAKKPS